VDRKEGGGCPQAPVYSAISSKVTPFLEAPVIAVFLREDREENLERFGI
jgi:hypothetical protein